MRIVGMSIAIFFVLMNVAYAGESVLLKLHGSNTIGAQLAPQLVISWMKKNRYTDIQLVEIRSEEKIISGVDLSGEVKTVQINSHGSATAFTSLERRAADIGMSSRPIKEKENNRLKAYGEMSRINAEYVIGLDGIAVIVNHANPLIKLDKTQIKDIFSGKIKRWDQIQKDLSGMIRVYARDDKSGTFDTFKALVLGKNTRLLTQAKRYESNDMLSDDVSKDVFGIGFVGLPSVRNAKALAISEQGALAKMPEKFEVATEDYAMARRLYLYVTDLHKNKALSSFIDFCLSQEGQNIVDRIGFISQNIQSRKVSLNSGYPDEYVDFTKESERLSLNIRFRKGTTKLDNKAMRDIRRLVDFLAIPENQGRRVMLFGFAESSETLPVFSLDLSTYRVDWVSNLLIQHGIDPIRVRSYGDAIPIASNEDAGGRHKNRRVEVWLQ